MNGILGKKLGMTQVFAEDGRVVPATVIASGPCSIIQIKNEKTDGYNAIQLGFDEVKEKRVKKPQRGLFKKAKVAPRKILKEFRINEIKDLSVGQNIDVSIFEPGDYINVTGTSKGKGFQGGIKRHHWKRGPESHGSMSHREPGSIGASAYPSRVVKGHPLPGHMGNQNVTTKNLEVVEVDKENNLLVVKGSVPGHNNAYLVIEKTGKKRVKKAQAEDKAKEEKKVSKAKPAKGGK